MARPNAQSRRNRQAGAASAPKPKKKKKYIENDELVELLLEYQHTQNREVLDIIVTDFFYVLSYKLIRGFPFKLIDEEDMLQEGAIACFKKLSRFDPTRGKPFNFFTTVILNQFRGMFKHNKAYMEFKRNLLKLEAIRVDEEMGHGRQLLSYLEEHDYVDTETAISEFMGPTNTGRCAYPSDDH